jgi:hypothetical protein
MKKQPDPKIIIASLLKEVENYVHDGETGSYLLDPVFGIVRNRVNAEVAKTYIRLGQTKKAIQLLRYVLTAQAEDGAWDEIHPNYRQKSALATAFIGDALVTAYPHFPQDTSLNNAATYVLQNEKKPGYFLKSLSYTADHLNVDASCGAFLAGYGNLFDDKKTIEAAKRAAEHICRFQKKGYFPYTTDKGNYPYTYNVPCIHYQGVTLYYLVKIQEIIDEPWLKKSIDDGTAWLASVQRDDGSFDWSKSGLMFAYYLSGAYAFAYAVFGSQSRRDERYRDNAQKCLSVINNNIPSFALRWESGNWMSFFVPKFITLKSAFLGEYPLGHRVFRYGYGSYRQIARRRYSEDPLHDILFQRLTKILHLSPSVIEASKNFPDLFMTSEILDCLSFSEYRRI